MNSKKFIPVIIGVVILIVLVVSATYAYFLVGTDYKTYTTSIGAEAESVGSVALKSGANLSLNLSPVDMMKQTSDVTYYATEDGTPQTTENAVTIATAEVTGEGIYSCNYTLSVAYSGTMKAQLPAAGSAILNVNGVDYDIYNTTFPMTISGTIGGVKNGTNKTIDGSLRVINLTGTDQSNMAGTNMTLTFTATEFDCTALDNSLLTTKVMALVGDGQVFDEGIAGIRYEGAVVDNWVSFNNETWRIIGVQEGSTIGLESGKFYTKLIRDLETEETMAYDSDGYHGGDWSATSLYTILNGDYYNRTGSYASNGLTTASKDLIIDANWYYTITSGYALMTFTSNDWFINERSDETKVINSSVGIMSPSDYSYAALQNICSNVRVVYYSDGCKNEDWLFNGEEWLINPASSFGETYQIFPDGSIAHTDLDNTSSKLIVRPIVYLDSDVKITNDGDGSETSMFEIGR